MLTLISLTDLNLFSELTLIPISIDLEIEPPILDSHIPLMRNECELQFFDLKLTIEPKPTLEPKLDFFESVLVPKPIFFEPKSTTLPNHVLLLDLDIEQNDSEMIFQDWSYNWDDFNVSVLHDPIHIKDYKYVNRKEVNKGGFREPPHYLD